jgi:hypothetical protein
LRGGNKAFAMQQQRQMGRRSTYVRPNLVALPTPFASAKRIVYNYYDWGPAAAL